MFPLSLGKGITRFRKKSQWVTEGDFGGKGQGVLGKRAARSAPPP